MKKAGILDKYSSYFLQEDWADFLLSHIDPTLTWKSVKARVFKIEQETPDTKSFYLSPNFHWKGFQPGQHIGVTLEIGGKRLTRYYSITSKKENPYIRITVKKQGLVSGYLHENISTGSVLTLTQAQGDFVFPGFIPEKTLFVAGGSGITPIYSLLKQIEKEARDSNIVLLYFSRTLKDIIFYKKLALLGERLGNTQIVHVLTHEARENFPTGFLSSELLQKYCPDFSERTVFLCGPKELKESARNFFTEEKLTIEDFQIGTAKLERKDSTKFPVKLSLSNKIVELKGEEPLLVELEKEGIFPPHGCRMGICHTCLCGKKSGEVKNVSDGNILGQEKEVIQLCNHVANSALELEL